MSRSRRHRKHPKPGLWRRIAQRLQILWGRIAGCARGQHFPNRSSARWHDGFWYTRCRACGVRLQRVAKGEWVADQCTDGRDH